MHGSDCVPGVGQAFAEVLRVIHGLRYSIPADGITGMYLLDSAPGCELVVQQTVEAGSGADRIQVISHQGIAMSQVTAVEATRSAAGEGVSAMGPGWRQSSVEAGRQSTRSLGFIVVGPQGAAIAHALHDLAIACGASASLTL